MMCECIAEINEQLKARNLRISQALRMTGNKFSVSQPSIMVENIDSRGHTKAPLLFATYCPFCGKKYEELEEKE